MKACAAARLAARIGSRTEQQLPVRRKKIWLTRKRNALMPLAIVRRMRTANIAAPIAKAKARRRPSIAIAAARPAAATSNFPEGLKRVSLSSRETRFNPSPFYTLPAWTAHAFCFTSIERAACLFSPLRFEAGVDSIFITLPSRHLCLFL